MTVIFTFDMYDIQIYNELSDPPIERTIYAAYTILELAENQRLQTLDMSYYRVPFISDSSVSEKVYYSCKHLHLVFP